MSRRRNIISFPTTASDGPGIVAQKKPTSERRRPRTCEHQRVWLDEDRRMIHCRDCKVFLEPYDWIVLMVRHQLWKFSSLEETRQMVDTLGKQLAELRREEKNTRARIGKMVREHGVTEGPAGEAIVRRSEWRKHCEKLRNRTGL